MDEGGTRAPAAAGIVSAAPASNGDPHVLFHPAVARRRRPVAAGRDGVARLQFADARVDARRRAADAAGQAAGPGPAGSGARARGRRGAAPRAPGGPPPGGPPMPPARRPAPAVPAATPAPAAEAPQPAPYNDAVA